MPGQKQNSGGKKGRSGRKSLKNEIEIKELCELSIRTVKSYLKNSDDSERNKSRIAVEIVKKYMPNKIEGKLDGPDIYDIIQQIQQDFVSGNCNTPVELGARNGMDKG